MYEDMDNDALAAASKAAFAAGEYLQASELRHALEQRVGVPVKQLGDGTLEITTPSTT